MAIDLRAESYKEYREGTQSESIIIDTDNNTVIRSGGGGSSSSSSDDEPVFSPEQYYQDTHSFEVPETVKPIKQGGEIIGYEDTTAQQSVLAPSGSRITPQSLSNVNTAYAASSGVYQQKPTLEQPKDQFTYTEQPRRVNSYDLITGNARLRKYEGYGRLTQEEVEVIRRKAYIEEKKKQEQQKKEFEESLNPIQRIGYWGATKAAPKLQESVEVSKPYFAAAMVGGAIAVTFPTLAVTAPLAVGGAIWGGRAVQAADVAGRATLRGPVVTNILGTTRTIKPRYDKDIDLKAMTKDLYKRDESVNELFRNVRDTFSGSQLNEEIRYFNTDFRQQAKDAATKAADEYGLTGQERKDWIEKSVQGNIQMGSLNYYLSQGMTYQEAQQRREKILNQAYEKENKAFKPFQFIPSTDVIPGGSVLKKISNWDIKKTLFDISPFFVNKDVVRTESEKLARKEGYTGSDFVKRAKTLEAQYYNRAYGRIGEDVSIEVIGELSGYGMLRRYDAAFKKSIEVGGKAARRQIAFNVAKSTAVGGLAEGGTAGFLYPMIYGEKPTVKDVATGAAFGAATAAAFGGTLGYFEAGKNLNVGKGQKLGARVTRTVGYIIDPYELPGDITADIAKTGTRATGKRLSILSLSTGNPEVTESGGGRQTQLKTAEKGVNLMNVPPQSNILTGTPAQVNTPANVPSLSDTIVSLPGIPSNTPVNTKTTLISNVPDNTFKIVTDIDIPSDIPTNIPVNIPTNVHTNVHTDTFTETFIPSFTPRLRFPPPVIFPPFLDFGGTGTGASGKGKRKKYVNELQLGIGILSDDASMIKASKKGGSKKKKGQNIINFSIFPVQQDNKASKIKKKKGIRNLSIGDLIGF